MSAEMIALIPNKRTETEKAEAIVAMDYPAIAPILPDIFHWTQDINSPVSQILQPFLVSIGAQLAPNIKSVLNGNDDAWKYDLVAHYIAHSSDLITLFKPELTRFATSPTVGEHKEEVDLVAREILDRQILDKPDVN